MKTTTIRLLVLLLLACACAAAGARESYTGASYTGRVNAKILEPGGAGGRGGAESGSGVARFVPLGGGRSRLEVQGSIRAQRDTGFVIEGSDSGDGWRGRSGDLELTIDRHGNISGGGVSNQHRISFGGRASAQRMDLSVETRKLDDDGRALPAGTRIVFDYALARGDRGARAAAAPAAEAKSSGDKKTCKRRVWKMRNVATPGGGMTMTQVPHCLD